MFSLAGRTALITGASSGLGAGFAQLLSAAGANVVLGARRLERVQKLAKTLVEEGRHALPVSMDVTEEDSIIAAFDQAEGRFGTINTVIANAGTASAGRSTEVPWAGLRQVIETNLIGAYLVAREGARRMIAGGSREREDGRIILIGSITADQAHTGDAAYSASKAGIAHLGRQFAKEWARLGINVNTIQPGWIHTEINDEWIHSEASAKAIAGLPRRRMLDANALDDMVLYLASDRSKAITGATFVIDDGQSL